ncbi:DUF4258 domain-containing protein [Abyssalbus ytuae]|uniref:DUF4258 domain-containing protein n=1 Tax=Abyssalbus ytuae TaxID=2926907 RepID=A0A9E7D1W9_9FLAO|nr:DUF4258 domain-containing protein [Abyssalbus ytuae]UOB17543.1 DUF4258 domain-containing protein [Abyssalbus ytuae]
MPLLKRLGFFLIGLSFGLVFLAYFLKGKNAEFCYLPNCRVLKDIRTKQIDFSPEVKQLFDNNTISKDQLNYILTEGDVIFSESNTKAKPCKNYIIRGYLSEKHVEFKIDNCSDRAIIKSIDIIQK